MRVDIDLKDKALDLVISEQKKYLDKKPSKIIGKERLVNILLAELYERRILDTIIEPHVLTSKEWQLFLKKK